MPCVRAGDYFMFAATGTTLNYCYHVERNLIIYKNIVTGKSRRMKGFINVDKITASCAVRYVKIMNRTLDKLYNDRREIEDLPF